MSFQLKIMLMFARFANCSLQVTWQPATQCLYLTIAVTPGFIRWAQTHFCTQPRSFHLSSPFTTNEEQPEQSNDKALLWGLASLSRIYRRGGRQCCAHFRALVPLQLESTKAAVVTLGSWQEWTRPGVAPENPTRQLSKQMIFVGCFLFLLQNSLSPGSCYNL